LSPNRRTREPWKPWIDDTLPTPTESSAKSAAADFGAPPPKPLFASLSLDFAACADFFWTLPSM